MKRAFLSVALTLMICIGFAQNWQAFTNNSHIYDAQLHENLLYLGSWGGAFTYGGYIDGHGKDYTWNTKDGISSNDVRSVAVSTNNALWLGTSTDGISIVNRPGGIQQINSTNGLPSDRVRKILVHDAQIYVATDLGLSVFYYLQGVNFPLLLHQYNHQNTSGGLAANDINDMVLTANNYLYLSTLGGLSYVHTDSLDLDSSWRKWTSANSPLPTGMKYSLSANSANIAISTINRVYKRTINPFDSSWSTFDQNSGVINYQISTICLDAADKLWIAYGAWNEDLMAYSLGVDTLMTSIDANGSYVHWAKNEAGLGASVISKFALGAELMFAATWGAGTYIHSNGYWENFLPNSIGFPKITDIKTDQNHTFWVSGGIIGAAPVRKSALGVSKYASTEWSTFNIANSPIITDNVLNIAVDSQNRKWFGTWDVTTGSPAGWKNGIAIYDDFNETWKHLTRLGVRTWDPSLQTWSANAPGSMNIMGNTIGALALDKSGNMLVGCYDHGVNVIGPNDTNIRTFTIPNSVQQRILFLHHNGRQYFIGTNNDRGLVIWNHASLPETGGEHWVIPPIPELNNCIVYGVASVESPFEGMQHWIAASTGLFMWNEQNWYKYDTTVKRSIYNSGWQNDQLYYVDEERLYASVRTTPTSLMLDPFGRIWIGSLEGGISRYNPKSDRFVNYNMSNAPLLSNFVTALGYEPKRGWLLIGTPDGLNALPIGKEIITTEELVTVKSYPNPFYPARDGYVRIVNMPEDSMPRGNNICRIYDSSGKIVIDIQQNEFARFDWDGRNKDGKNCSSGVYFYVVTDEAGRTKRGKIALIR